MPLALVLNELLTNAAKHGANDRGLVIINVGLSQRSGSHELYVQDRGPGFNFECEVDPVSWTPDYLSLRSLRWQENTHPMRRSSVGRW